MSDIERLARIAGQELQLTEKALDDIRADALWRATQAKDPETAFRELQTVRVVDAVRTKLRSYEHTRAIDVAAQANRQAED